MPDKLTLRKKPGGNVGIGFAIPAGMARVVASQLARFGRVMRGQLRVAVRDHPGAMPAGRQADLPPGAMVATVFQGSAAAKAGRPGAGPFSGFLLLLVLAASLLAPERAVADTHSGYFVKDGIAVYYAVLPAEIIRGHPKQHPEAAMHGGVPGGPHVHHLLLGLFEAKSLERIVDAEVTATVGEVGLAGQQRKLEPFTVAGALTYGNYFDMLPRTDYRVTAEIRRPGSKEAMRVEFDFKHE